MIAYLTGTILHKDLKYVVLMTSGGTGYKVYTTLETHGQVSAGAEASLWIHTVVREDALDLYGFSDKKTLEFFELLITISGIGPKSALGILSAASVSSIREAVISGETAYLTKIAGVGKKVAEKIVLELKDKVGPDEYGTGTGSGTASSADVDALDALMSIGYSQKESKDVLDELSKQASRGDIDPLKNAGDKVKAALKLLGK